MKIEGRFSTRQVWIDGRELSPQPSQSLWNHSPDGFAWGYAGSGPAQLALAVLLAAGLRERDAVRMHQEFKASVVQHLPETDFVIDVDMAPWVAAFDPQPPDCECRNPRCGHKASEHVGADGACVVAGCRCGPGGWT